MWQITTSFFNSLEFDAFKRDLHRDITNRKRLLEAETGLVIQDVELVFVDVSSIDQPYHLLSEIKVTV